MAGGGSVGSAWLIVGRALPHLKQKAASSAQAVPHFEQNIWPLPSYLDDVAHDESFNDATCQLLYDEVSPYEHSYQRRDVG